MMESDPNVVENRHSPLPGGESSNHNLAIPFPARLSRLGSPIQPAVPLKSELMELTRARLPLRAAITGTERQTMPPPLRPPAPPGSNNPILQTETQESKNPVLRRYQDYKQQEGRKPQPQPLPGQALNLGGALAQEELPQTHYTISEDEVGGSRDMLDNLAKMQQARRQLQIAAKREAELAMEAQATRSVPTNRMPMPVPLDAASRYGKLGAGFDATANASSALSPGTDLARSMLEYIHSLEAHFGIPKSNLDMFNAPTINIQVFHCLGDREDPETYLVEPEWQTHDDEIILRGYSPVRYADGYIENRGNIAFAVYKHYTVEHQKSEVEQAMKANEPLPSPQPAYQDVKLVSSEMVQAVKAFIAHYPTFCADLLESDGRGFERMIISPHIWWYHCRKKHKTQDLPPGQANLVAALTDWLEASFGPLYNAIEHQFRTGRVSGESIEYFIHPGQILVLKDDGSGMPKGYLATERPRFTIKEGQQKLQQRLWEVNACSYSYAGEFYRTDKIITLHSESNSLDREVDIANLKAAPLQYAGDEIKEVLERRGKTFWKCRGKRLVSYEADPNSKDKKHARQRFMTDFATYKELHPDNPYLRSMSYQKIGMAGHDSLGSHPELDLPTDGSEPAAPSIYLFPGHLPGFDLRRKKWVNLEVDRIGEVAWNDEAFHSLVADEDMKELVLALVTNQLASETATDLIDSKGNGLIMLLHGSPGTGKTFTAESVAEIARKPLYSVTCGDIGTEPDIVEQYLSKVFNLGKIWDCVVLLDEAEVFLEQRTLQDLKRNALVSVFLRQLEYYEGILILTTNRVGTFDEAFKSRIQLALRYEPLGRDQRKQVWRNFLNRLRALGEGDSIDFSEVASHMDELAGYEMNGREIRNAITTGRQLAKYMKEKMTFGHLKRAIGVTEKFDRYLAEVREADADDAGGRGADGRYSAEYFARADGTR
ncbi:hypothetical protein RB601_003242 [Gaeumannomyces tritici]